jgi:hypothetical protein
MPDPARGEVWLVDLGTVVQIRPPLVLRVPAGERDRSLVALVAHTTSKCDSQFKVAVPVCFLNPERSTRRTWWRSPTPSSSGSSGDCARRNSPRSSGRCVGRWAIHARKSLASRDLIRLIY